MMHVSTNLALFTVLVIGQFSRGWSEYSTEQPCRQEKSPMVILGRDPVSGAYEVVHRFATGESLSFPGVQARMLKLDSTSTSMDDGGNAPAGYLRTSSAATTRPGVLATQSGGNGQSIRGLQARKHGNHSLDFESEDELYYAWECGCHDTSVPVVYCPLSIDTCLQPNSWSQNDLPGCRNIPVAYEFRRYSLLAIGFFFAAILTALLSTNLGTSLFGFMVSQCFPCWNVMAVDRLMRRHPERVRDMIRIHIIREQRALFETRRQQEIAQAAQSPGNPGSGGDNGLQNEERDPRSNDETEESREPPTSLALRIKKYKRPSRPRLTFAAGDESNVVGDTSSDTEEEDQCTICFLALQDGDRVGSLKCHHLFHSECLKLWLQRRNTCPLCQSQDIAEPRYDEVLTDSETAASHTDSQGEHTHSDVE